MRKAKKRNLAEASATILYDPTPANGRQLRQWAKDSMNMVLRDPARREMAEPEGHAAPEWEKQCCVISLFWYVQFEHGIK